MLKEYFVKCSSPDKSQPLRRDYVNGKVDLDLSKDYYEITNSAKHQIYDKWSDIPDFTIDFMIEVPAEKEEE